MVSEGEVSYQFGPFLLCPRDHLLLNSGRPVALKPKAFETLLVLVESGGHLVTKEDLMRRIWSDAVVEEGNLSLAVHQARKALDSQSECPYIVTVPRRGYRFVEPVTIVRDIVGLPQAGGPTKEVVANGEHKGALLGLRGPMNFAGDPQRWHSIPNKQESLLGGHASYAIVSSAMYSTLFGVGILVQVAYRFDDYRRGGFNTALLTFFCVFVGSMVGFAIGWKCTTLKREIALIAQCLTFLTSAAVGFAIGCMFLPNIPVVQASFQTCTAQAAYLKDTCYFLVLALLYLVIPFQFVIAMQRELEDGRSSDLMRLLKGDPSSVAPKGTVYPRFWILILFLFGLCTSAVFFTTRLFSNLSPKDHVNLYMQLILLRWILYFGLAVLALAWYHRELNEIKRQCLASRSHASSAPK